MESEMTSEEKQRNLEADIQHLLVWNCEVSMRYHAARVSFFNSLFNVVQLLVLAVLCVTAFNIAYDPSIQEAVVIFVALTVLVAIGAHIRLNKLLYKTLYEALCEIYEQVGITATLNQETLNEIERRMIALYATEPYGYRALLALCDNQVSIAKDAPPGYYVPLRWYHKMLRNVFRFQGTDFVNQNQVNARLG